VTEFSHRSRRRLRERALDLGEMERADMMVTLTLPGEWRTVCPDGRRFKSQVKAWRARLGRHFRAHGVGTWAALWFLEFQARGAPHLHIIFWGPGIRALQIDAFREWCSDSWAEVVGHPDEHERSKHRAAGTRVEWMRRDHFGYAVKYASKMRQSRVPEDFRNVGRFWGFWRYRAPEPIAWSIDVDEAGPDRLVRKLASVAVTQRFGSKLVARFQAAARHSDTFGATVYGTAAVYAALDLDWGSVVLRAEDLPPEVRSDSGTGPPSAGGRS
jgi:hypothetical protein